MQSIAISAREINKSFGSLQAVDNVSLELRAGECIAALGPNGAGKTTTIEILEGLQTADRGELKILGMDYTKDRNKIYAEIGILLQQTRLYQKYTVLETLQLFSSFYAKHGISISTEQILEQLSEFSLVDKKNTRLGQLSGGQYQRVQLLCSLIHQPKLLFLDEPTTGLDPAARHFLWEILETKKSEGCSIYLTTHDMHEAEFLADRVYIFDQGKIKAEGTTCNLISKYSPETHLIFNGIAYENVKFFREAFKDTRIETIAFGPNYHVKITAPKETLSHQLAQFLQSKNYLNYDFEFKKPNLENVFLQLTGRRLSDGDQT